MQNEIVRQYMDDKGRETIHENNNNKKNRVEAK